MCDINTKQDARFITATPQGIFQLDRCAVYSTVTKHGVQFIEWVYHNVWKKSLKAKAPHLYT